MRSIRKRLIISKTCGTTIRAGKGSSEAYLEEWRRDSRPCSDDLEAEANAEAERLEGAFSDEQLTALIRAKGVAS